MVKLAPETWGSHYWFFLHTAAFTYPDYPNAVTKRKYYDLIHNFPLFIPDPVISAEFEKLLEKFPFVSYLDKKESLIIWVHFIHNKINGKLGKPEIPFLESVDKYIHMTRSRDSASSAGLGDGTDNIFYLQYFIYSLLIFFLIFIIYYIHKI